MAKDLKFAESGNSPPTLTTTTTRTTEDMPLNLGLVGKGAGKRERDEIERKVRRRAAQGTGSAKDMENAWITWLAGYGCDDLLREVRAYCVKKLYSDVVYEDAFTEKRHHISNSISGDCDDMAQELCLEVWIMISEDKIKDGTGPGEFRELIKTMCKRKVWKAYQDIKSDRETFVPFHVSQTDEDGNVTEVENPVLYENTVEHKMIRLPESLQGEDLQICRWMLAGMNYAEIAKEVGLTEAAVQKRVQRMKERFAGDRAVQNGKRAKNDAPEKERQTYRTRMNQEYVAKVMARVNVPEYDGPEWEVPEREPERESANVAAGVTTVPAGEEGEQ